MHIHVADLAANVTVRSQQYSGSKDIAVYRAVNERRTSNDIARNVPSEDKNATIGNFDVTVYDTFYLDAAFNHHVALKVHAFCE